MFINRLDIKGFGKVKGLSLDFTNGLNIVFGNNESGKTTIQWFIRGMLYGLKGGRASKEGIPPPMRKFRPWDGGDFGGSMEYTLDNGNRFRVERDFESNSVKVFDSFFNNITHNFDFSKDRNLLFAEKQLGFSEDSFEKTVFIKQMESKIDIEGSRELGNSLLNVTQTGFYDVSFRKAEAALKEALRKQVGTERTSKSPMDRIAKELEELYEKRESLINKKDSLITLEAELTKVKIEEDRLKRIRNLIYKCRELLDLREELDRCRKELAELGKIHEQVEDTHKELVSVSDNLQQLGELKCTLEEFFGYTNEESEALFIKYHEYLGLSAQVTRLEREMEVRAKDKSVKAAKNKYGHAAIILFLLSIISAIAGVMWSEIAFAPAAFMLTASIILFVFWNRGIQSAKLNEDICILLHEHENYKKSTKQVEDEIRASLYNSGVIADISTEFGEEELKSFKWGVSRAAEAASSIEHATRRVKDIEGKLDLLYGKASLITANECLGFDELEEYINTVAKKEIELEKRFNRCLAEIENPCSEDLSGYDIPITKEDFIYQETNELRTNLKAVSEKLEDEYGNILLKERELETVINGMCFEEEELQGVEEEIFGHLSTKSALEAAHASLSTALEVLTEASIEIQRDFGPELNSRMSKIIERITGDRYLDLRADDKLNLNTINPDTSDVTAGLLLSGGTIDQIYLCLRIAAADMMTHGKENIPLFMDEIFAQYDDIRSGYALEYLNEAASSRQVVIFTCKRREIDIAREICRDKLNVIYIGDEI